MIYNVFLVSSVQQNDSVLYLYLYVFFLFHIHFCYRLLKDTEYRSLCYTVGPFCLYILYTLYIGVCICQSQVTNLSPPRPISPLVIINLFPVSLFLWLTSLRITISRSILWVCFCFINKFICIIFLNSTCKFNYDICLSLTHFT